MRLRHVLALALLGAAGSAHGQRLNTVSAIHIEDAGGAVVLSVRGNKPPSFTTFPMADPPRFVIDLSEARFQGVPDEIPVNDGTIRLVKNLSYGSDASSIARIMIAFSAEVEPPEVVSQGSDLVVRIAKPAGVPVARERTVPAAEERQAASDAPTEKEPAAIAAQQAEAAGDAPQDDARNAQEESERQRAEAAAAAEADRKRQEEADRAAEAARQREEATAAAEPDRKAQEEADRAAEAARQREDATAAAEAGRQREQEAEAAGQREQEAEAARQREEAIAAARAGAERNAREDALAAEAPSAQLREVGFRQMAGVSRVFVRTSVPPRFTIQDMGENVVRVQLENTRVMRTNDARFLDTSFFPSAVAMVTPSRVGSSYVVDIKLRERVPYQQRIEGDMLAIDFERAAGDGATPSAAPAGLVLDGAPADVAGEADAAGPGDADAAVPGDAAKSPAVLEDRPSGR